MLAANQAWLDGELTTAELVERFAGVPLDDELLRALQAQANPSPNDRQTRIVQAAAVAGGGLVLTLTDLEPQVQRMIATKVAQATLVADGVRFASIGEVQDAVFERAEEFIARGLRPNSEVENRALKQATLELSDRYAAEVESEGDPFALVAAALRYRPTRRSVRPPLLCMVPRQRVRRVSRSRAQRRARRRARAPGRSGDADPHPERVNSRPPAPLSVGGVR